MRTGSATTVWSSASRQIARVIRTQSWSGQAWLARGRRGGPTAMRSSRGFGAVRRLAAAVLLPDSYVGWVPFAVRAALEVAADRSRRRGVLDVAAGVDTPRRAQGAPRDAAPVDRRLSRSVDEPASARMSPSPLPPRTCIAAWRSARRHERRRGGGDDNVERKGDATTPIQAHECGAHLQWL